MVRKKQRKKQTKRRAGPAARRHMGQGAAGRSEWVGGRLTMPVYITKGEPFRPEMIVWLELPQDLVVGSALIDPDQPPVSFGGTLIETMRAPMVGPPRRPSRVRVADARLAAEIRQCVPDMDVAVEATPELDRLLRLMAEGLPAGAGANGPSYFEGGRIAEESLEQLFRASALLFRVAPWKVAGDGQVLRVDIPQLGVEGGCVSIIGALGESLGFILFPSFIAYERFLVAARETSPEGSIDAGTTMLSLNFENASDLPPSMRKEAARHGWPVAAPNAYPWVQHRERDGVLRPTTERDVRVISACATSLVSFFAKHGGLFARESFSPICESFFDEDDLEVRFTVPYDSASLFAVNDVRTEHTTRQAAGRVGRNEPCPCGSGKKYKKCCLGTDQPVSGQRRALASIHEIDQRLVERMMGFAARRFGDDWCRVAEDFHDPEQAIQLFGPWSVYGFAVEGKPVVRWFRESEGQRLSNTERTWLEAQEASWLSVWEVEDADFGRSITLTDLLSGETRTVHEVSGSKTLARRDVLLARIVDHDGLSVLCGSHPRPLPPLPAAEVVRRVRGRLRRQTDVPIERLQNDAIGRYMIGRWEEAVLELDQQRRLPPRLQNTDGDELLLTVDHFELDAADKGEIAKRLASIEGVEPPEPEDEGQGYFFSRGGNAMHRDWDTTLIGRAHLSSDRLRLESNSIKRADDLRRRVEATCGGLLRHRVREHTDPTALMQGSGAEPRPAGDEQSEIPPEEVSRLIREHKERHYADWPEHPLPALNGSTPRDALRTKAGRRQVDLLLKDCENHEARLPAEQQYDFSKLRAQLGLARP